MISEYMELSTLSEVLDCKIYSQQFPVKGTVACLGSCHLSGDGVPGAIDVLLEDFSNSSV